jgi:L-lactate dehydrogenase
LALVRITEAILRNRRSVLTVSTFLEGEYGISDVALSVPSLVAKQGIAEIIIGKSAEEEHQRLKNSALLFVLPSTAL